MLSEFDFETKERKRLSQNVGTKRQPAAATREACIQKNTPAEPCGCLHHSAVHVWASVAHRRPNESPDVSIQAFPAHRRPNESLSVSIEAFPAHGSVQGRTSGPKFGRNPIRPPQQNSAFADYQTVTKRLRIVRCEAVP